MGFQEYFTVEMKPVEGTPEAVAADVTVKDWEWQREDMDELVAFLDQLAGPKSGARMCGQILREQQQSSDRRGGVGMVFLAPAANYPGMTLVYREEKGKWCMEPKTQSLERARASA